MSEYGRDHRTMYAPLRSELHVCHSEMKSSQSPLFRSREKTAWNKIVILIGSLSTIRAKLIKLTTSDSARSHLISEEPT
jgi:hypothetical protein